MTISLVATATNNTNNTTSMSLAVPTGTADDDVILFFGSCDGTNGYTAPAGFTVLHDVNTSGSHNNILAWKVASSEPANYTVNVASGSERGWGIFATYRGVDTVSPIDGSSSNIGGSNSTCVLSSLTPSVDNCAVAAFVGLESGNSGAAVATSWPSSLVEQSDNVNGPPGNGSASSSGAFSDIVQTAASAVSGNVPITGGDTFWGAMLVALAPASVALSYSLVVDSSSSGTVIGPDYTLEDLDSFYPSLDDIPFSLDDINGLILVTHIAVNGDASSSATTSSSPAFSVQWALGVDSASSVSACSVPVLSVNYALSVDSSSSVTVSTTPTIAVEWSISVDGCASGSQSSSPALAVNWALGVDSPVSNTGSSSPTLAVNWGLTVAASVSGSDASTPTLIDNFQVLPDSAASSTASSIVTLILKGWHGDAKQSTNWNADNDNSTNWTDEADAGSSWAPEAVNANTWAATTDKTTGWT